MSHRYQAPEHTSEIFTSTGPKRADKSGVITLAPDAPASDHAELRRAGCQVIGSSEAKSAPKPRSSKAPAKKSSGKSKAAAKSAAPAPAEPPSA